ncbi:Pyridoxamine 5'-phosphate oxidase-related protein [Actinobacteria bacterium OV450]|nr:Pyridoxamine 5'-phosphate oxidase-related protein [Actinobacteria bacterium OV450]
MDHEGIRRPAGRAGASTAARHMRELDRAEALRLLATVSLGRIVFTQHALPAVRPVNHVVDGEDIVIRIHGGGALASLAAPADAPGVVVAYEADVIDPDTHLGWSVVVTGYASPVTDADDADRYADLVHPWVAQAMTGALRIRPDLVTGFRLEAAPPRPTPPRPAPAAC